MSTQLNPAIQYTPIIKGVEQIPNAIELHEEVGCWQRIKDGVYYVCSIVVHASSSFIQVISCVAFSAIRVIWPGGADRLEIFWGHITAVYERVVAAIREEGLLEDIQRLEEKNHNLELRNRDLAMRVEGFRVGTEHLNWEKGVLTQELDLARRERDERVEGKAHLIRERDQLQNDKQLLEQGLAEAVREKDAAIQAKDQQEVELIQALQQVGVFKKQVELVDRKEELLQQFRRIDVAYEQQKTQEEGQPNMTELELQQLLLIYEQQKPAYIQMIQESLQDLPLDHALQVPIQGLLRISNEEAGHVKRISEEMHFYAELKKTPWIAVVT